MEGENAGATSEFCPKADSEELGPIEGFFPYREREIETNRADGGLPRHAYSGARPGRWRLFDHGLHTSRLNQLSRGQHNVGRFELIESAEIGEDATAQSQLLGQAERHAQRDRTNIVFLPAKGVAADRVTGADAGALKAAQIVAADKEPILEEDLLAVPTDNVADFPGQAQHPFRCDRVEIAEIRLVSYIVYTKPHAGEVIADRGIIAARRVEPVIPPIVEQNLADLRGQMRS